jgi:hypothetical protein
VKGRMRTPFFGSSVEASQQDPISGRWHYGQ